MGCGCPPIPHVGDHASLFFSLNHCFHNIWILRYSSLPEGRH
uniref:Uncharacterized protein n=1 Tax=Rhizophora mucronata TaxID=61149 RepID=A0A2P2NZN1_RHIMU